MITCLQVYSNIIFRVATPECLYSSIVGLVLSQFDVIFVNRGRCSSDDPGSVRCRHGDDQHLTTVVPRLHDQLPRGARQM